ncbi:MAG: ATP-dependent helicase [Muribaculaceae bacterium]|nr:ATP-dependent helicase [Muribaculaceae bacterium]
MLTPSQQRAQEASEGRVRVVAGAGSGKTRVLAHRFAYLVNDLGIAPGNILCITFTNKAAQEMKHRISAIVDSGAVNDFVCTIHSFCVKFLRREIYRIGYPKSFTVIDEEDCKLLAKQAMQEWGIDRKKTTVERFLKSVAALKGWDPDAYIQRHLLPNASPECPDAIIRYIRLQLKLYALDYDDLLYFTLYILNNFPDAREYWTDKLNYVMVDEVQDCSGDDWKLLHALTSKHGNLFVVGDPDQAIYEWRGGNPRIFVEFKAQTDIILDRNFRSTPDILDVANSIIENNKNRVKKTLYTKRLNEHPVVYRHCKTEKEEAQMIADTIMEGLRNGQEPSDFAILYRSSFLSRQVEQALLRNKLPYTVWGGVRFFERREIKDVLAYLRLIANEADDLSFTRIVNIPSRKFGDASLKLLRTLAEEENTPLFTTLCNNITNPKFNRAPMHEFVALIQNARELAEHLNVSELTDNLLTRSGLADTYRTDESEERLENIHELINAMREFEKAQVDETDAGLYGYLQEISLYANPDFHRDGSHVRLMTIHQSKGLEFPTVFIIGLTEGIFPNHRSIRERRKDGEEEERRLMYVAVTRACDMLYLSESEGYMDDNGALKYPSRFLTEVDTDLLKIEGDPDPKLLEGTRNLISILESELYMRDDAVWTAGTVVSHKVFGQGTVQSYDPASKSYRVAFGNNIRNLVPRVLAKV